MANKFLESFDHYTTLSQKWTGVTTPSGSSFVIQAGSARTGANGLKVTGCTAGAAGTAWSASIPGLGNQATYILGFAFRASAFAGVRAPLCFMMDAGAYQGSLGYDSIGRLVLLRGSNNGGTVLATSVKSMLINTWYYVEWKYTVGNPGGVAEVRVNGEVWATFAGNTQVTGNAFSNQVSLGGAQQAFPTPFVDIEDLYLNDGTGGAPNNTYWGDTQVECLKPNGVGNYTELTTLVGAASHWQAVNEVPPNEDTSYVGSTTVDQRDTFTMDDLAVVSAQINSVQVVMRAREDVAGAANVARMYRRAATDNQGADTPVGTTYQNLLEILEQDPLAGPGAWTVANVNAAEFGVRVR